MGSLPLLIRDIFFRSTSESSEMAILRPRARRGLLQPHQPISGEYCGGC